MLLLSSQERDVAIELGGLVETDACGDIQVSLHAFSTRVAIYVAVAGDGTSVAIDRAGG